MRQPSTCIEYLHGEQSRLHQTSSRQIPTWSVFTAEFDHFIEAFMASIATASIETNHILGEQRSLLSRISITSIYLNRPYLRQALITASSTLTVWINRFIKHLHEAPTTSSRIDYMFRAISNLVKSPQNEYRSLHQAPLRNIDHSKETQSYLFRESATSSSIPRRAIRSPYSTPTARISMATYRCSDHIYFQHVDREHFYCMTSSCRHRFEHIHSHPLSSTHSRRTTPQRLLLLRALLACFDRGYDCGDHVFDQHLLSCGEHICGELFSSYNVYSQP